MGYIKGPRCLCHKIPTVFSLLVAMMDVDLYDSTYCRLCAEENSSGVLLYGSDGLEDELSTLINRYLPFKVQDDGKLPRTICPGCNIQLQSTVQFFDLLVEGQKKIRELWKNQVELRKRLEREQQRAEREDAQLLLTTSTSDPNGGEDGGSKIFIKIMADGTLYSEDHEMALRMEGLEKPRRKRGRPKKVHTQPVVEPPPPQEEKNEEIAVQENEVEESSDGRRRRKRKAPQRFMEVVQGKELEKIFREEGVIDEDEQDEVEQEDLEERVPISKQDNSEGAEVIGHMESLEGQDLGELVIVNKGKSRTRTRTKRRKLRFQCEVCGRGFLHKGRYLMHKSYHKGVKFECSACNKRFTSREHFELHQTTTGHTGEGIIEGLEDGKDILELPTKNRYPCEQCDKSFQTKQSYEVHMKAIHEGQKPFTCEICGKMFAYHNSIKAHMAIHEERNDKGYPCDICEKLFNHPSSVIYHKEAEHNNGRRFVCNKCGKGFKHKQLLQRHQLVHSDSRPFLCKACGATFKTRANLLNHMPTHTGEKKYFCELCGHQFAHKTSLTLHYRWHTGQKPYQCQVCSKSFSQNGNLQEHMRIHTGEKPFCCDYCGRKFTTSSQFKLHVKRHTGERPWKCEYCGKSFLHKDTWKCHTRRHKGERPFQCHFCARGFTEQWALKKHLRLHTGEKPYVCNICGKAFADCSNLTKHKKVHQENSDVLADNGTTGAATTDVADQQVWSIIHNEFPKEVVPNVMQENEEITEEKVEDDSIQQIIYVTYDDPEDLGEESRALHIVDHMRTETPAQAEDGSEVTIPDEATVVSLTSEPDLHLNALTHPGTVQLDATHTLQVTDEDGNPIRFTMQDGHELQITTTDGQSITVTTMDGQTIPLHLTPDGHQFATHITDQMEAVVEGDAVIDQNGAMDDVATLTETEGDIEFTTQDGQKVRFVTAYVDSMQLTPDYLTTA